MPIFAVQTDVNWNVVWVGEAESGSSACACAARALGLVGEFRPYDFQPPAHKEDGVARLLLHVSDISTLETPATLDHVQRYRQTLLTEERSIGCFMALHAED